MRPRERLIATFYKISVFVENFYTDSENIGKFENLIIDFEKIRAKERAHKTGNVPKMSQLSLTDVPTFALERGYQ